MLSLIVMIGSCLQNRLAILIDVYFSQVKNKPVWNKTLVYSLPGVVLQTVGTVHSQRVLQKTPGAHEVF